ncbi:sentrin-specific protease 1-like isoform X2 [Lycorma delicatula]|uniref:sentrin-specific protease 1-like isoform X2 n=1 Tax=Lycorma delicatula TaxID=130591 RepID=UPI003F5125E7
MEYIVDFFGKIQGIYSNWFTDSDRIAIGSKRRRNNFGISENIAPKRLKYFHSQTQTQPEYFRKGSFQTFSSQPEKLQSMNRFGSLYDPSVRSIRPPHSWFFSMDKEVIEFSSDEDNDNDIQVIGEESANSRNPLSSLTVENTLTSSQETDVQVLKVMKKGKELQQNGSQIRTSFPLSTSSVAPSHRKTGRFHSPGLKKDLRKSHYNDKPKLLNMTMQIDSKEKYSALLKSFICGPVISSSSSSSSFANLQDVERNMQANSSSINLKPKKVLPEVQVIDLTKPKEKRRTAHLTVKAVNTKTEGDDSDIEILSIKPVARVNSFDQQLKRCPYYYPDWLQDMKERWNTITEEKARQVKEETIKKLFFAKSNRERLDAVEEKIRRHMTITDSVILDEPVEAEEEIPELTTEMENRITNALYPKPSNEVVAEGFSLRITRKDMHTLAKLNWLNDEVINFYMNLLIERGKKDKMPKVYAFNTFFYPKLIESGHASLKRWTRKVDVFAHDLIVVPVHLGVHWCMAIIDFRNKVVEYYDSMGHPNNKCLNALLKYLQEESLDKKSKQFDISSWKTKNMADIPQQMNGSDCGMFACTFAEYKCRNAKINFSQEDMPYFRRKMVYEILTARLMIA